VTGSRFNADLRLLPMDSEDWELCGELNGVGLAAHNMTTSTQAALDKMLGWVGRGDGVLTAAKRAFRHAEKTLLSYPEYGAEDAARGVLMTIIEEYARRRFEVDLDLFWELEESVNPEAKE